MSNELKHLSVGTSLTQIEYEAVGGHVCDSQATGDVLYASSPTQISRLGIGTANQALIVSGGIPAWSTLAAGGDVTGPASSTDNEIARQHSTTGKVLQTYTSNPPTVSDTGDMNIDGDLDVEGIIATSIAVPTITSAANIALTATDDVVIPANVGITFGTGEKIEGDSTDLTVTSGGAINLTATTDVVVPANVGVTFGTGEKIEGDNTDLTLTSGADITLAATADVNIPVNIGLSFGDGGENIETNNTDFTIISGGELNLSAASDVVIPVNIGLHFGDGAETIESNNTDLTINSGVDINLTATTDINVPANVGLTFGDDGEKIEGDGSDLTVASGGILNLTAATSINVNSPVQLTENSVQLDALLSGDETWSGITELGTMGYGATVGDLMYLAVADTKWELAKADAAATSKGKIGLCTATTNENSTCQVLLWGKMRSAAFPALTVGAPVHISAATAGDIVVAAPTGTTNFVVRIIGYGNTAEDLAFMPDNSYVELA